MANNVEVPLSEVRDRAVAVLGSTQFNGIDFVELVPGVPYGLRVHFVNAVPIAPAPGQSLKVTITGGDRIPQVNVLTIAASIDANGRPLLVLQVQNPADPSNAQEPPGDFSNYTLAVAGAPTLDARFASTVVNFRALCPTDFDCAPPPVVCPVDDTPLPPIDYTAKDFQSFRQALTDFSALRYPGWQERSEADFGMMFVEALSAVGDELSYLQDRIAAEAALETATQRRSLVSLARLVDYEPVPAISATTVVMFTVPPNTTSLPSGVRVSATGPDGSQVPFEVGAGLSTSASFDVSSQWNFPLYPYWWDDSQRCLPRGATDMWIQGQGLKLQPGMALLIQTDLPGQSVREVVHLVSATEEQDPLFANSSPPFLAPQVPPALLTHLFWEEPLVSDHDLTVTLLGGNLVPVTQGQRVADAFAIPANVALGEPAPPSGVPLAIARWGPNSSASLPKWVFRFPLTRGPLAWLGSADPSQPAAPDLVLTEQAPAPRSWTFETSLLTALSGDFAFTVDPVAWRPLALAPGAVPFTFENDGDQGSTIRFGDGVFGVEPDHGSTFLVTYRVGLGATGNVAADTISNVDPSWTSVALQARNPFAVTNGADAETPEQIQVAAPQAFRAEQFRAVRPEDYEAAAETLPWVIKAGTSFRWTGSWLTVFTAADPRGATVVTPQDEVDLIQLLNRRRLAGYESYAPPPTHVSIDLLITVCSLPEWLPGDVERGVVASLGSSLESGAPGDFFFSEHFTFGTPLYRSRLEAAIQAVPGVRGVLAVFYRRRGLDPVFVDLPPILLVATHEILRVDNDPSFPERGTIRVLVEGGR